MKIFRRRKDNHRDEGARIIGSVRELASEISSWLDENPHCLPTMIDVLLWASLVQDYSRRINPNLILEASNDDFLMILRIIFIQGYKRGWEHREAVAPLGG